MKSTFDMHGPLVGANAGTDAGAGTAGGASARTARTRNASWPRAARIMVLATLAVVAVVVVTGLVIFFLRSFTGANAAAPSAAAGLATRAPTLAPAAGIGDARVEREGALLEWSLAATGMLALLLITGIALLLQRERLQRRCAAAERGAERRRVDDAVRHQTAALSVANANLTRLSRHSLLAQEEERHHLSAELHDEISGQVAAMMMNLHRIAQSMPATADPGLVAAVRDSVAIARKTYREVCDLAVELRPGMLDQLGLVATLQWFARERQRGADCRIEVAAQALACEPGADIATAAYRIVQESVNNALRHARASTITIEVRQHPHQLELVVRDDGRGFELDEGAVDGALSRGFGLLEMRERAISVGAELQIDPRPGSGTRLRLVLPAAGASDTGPAPG